MSGKNGGYPADAIPNSQLPATASARRADSGNSIGAKIEAG